MCKTNDGNTEDAENMNFFGFGSGLVKKASGWVGFLGISWHITGRRFISRGSTGCQNLWRYERYIISYLWCTTEAGISSTYIKLLKFCIKGEKNVVMYLTHFCDDFICSHFIRNAKVSILKSNFLNFPPIFIEPLIKVQSPYCWNRSPHHVIVLYLLTSQGICTIHRMIMSARQKHARRHSTNFDPLPRSKHNR